MNGIVSSETHTGSSDQIQSALQEIFNSLEGNFIRSMSTNRVLLVAPTTSQRSIDTLIDTLASTQPGRFFVLIRDEEQSDIKLSVSARCNQLSRGQSICSEVVSLRYSGKSERSIPSIVKAHILTGRRVELILLEAAPIDTLFHEFCYLSEILIFDSAYYWKKESFLETIPDAFTRAIDVQWLLLAPWREAIRTVFDAHVHFNELINLKEITVSCSAAQGVQPFLFASWLIKALQLMVHSYSESAFNCTRSHSVDAVRLLLNNDSSDSDPTASISQVRFSFDSTGVSELIWKQEQQAIVALRSDVVDNILMSQQIDTSTAVEAINRYFLIGESTVQYAAALRTSLALSALAGAFSSHS